MVDLKDIPELHDKIIISTAKYLNLPLITKDKALQNNEQEGTTNESACKRRGGTGAKP